jgi:hypothetical protein
MSLRQAYENCATNAYLDLLVEGSPRGPVTVESALDACQTEAQQIQSLLLSTNMEPKLVFSIMTNLRVAAKHRLLGH